MWVEISKYQPVLTGLQADNPIAGLRQLRCIRLKSCDVPVHVELVRADPSRKVIPAPDCDQASALGCIFEQEFFECG